MNKLRAAFGAGASCAGCDVAVLNLGEKLLSLFEKVEFVFWTTATDFKKEDLRSYEELDLAIFAGSVRTDEHEELVKLLRQKSKIVIALGSCACFGGIPSLANLYDKSELLNSVYKESASSGEEREIPRPLTELGKAELTLPELRNWCDPLDYVTSVNVYVPGCPPQEGTLDWLLRIVDEYHQNRSVPHDLTLASEKSLCDTCARKLPKEISIDKLYRVHEIKLDETKCFLQQGVLCLGPVTKGGCDEKCIKANMPCRGCMGPVPTVKDSGAKIISVLGAILQSDKEKQLGEDGLKKTIENIHDLTGSLYSYLIPLSLIEKIRRNRSQ
jgi:F420-non-reducing hydrogenase small subunit